MKKAQQNRTNFNDADWDTPPNSPPSQNSGWQASPASGKPAFGGSWHVILTLVCLIATVILNYFITLLTWNYPGIRPWWMLGLVFMLPATVVLMAAYAVESATSAMTPRFNRKPQFIVLLITMVLTFVLGCFASYTEVETEVQPVTTATAARYLFLLDRSASMEWNDPNNQSAKAIKNMLDTLPDEAEFGMVLFSHELINTIPIQKLSKAHRDRIMAATNTPPQGGTEFELVLDHALKTLANTPQGMLTTKIVMVTDAEDDVNGVNDIIAKSKSQQAPISAVVIAGKMDFTLQTLVSETGGKASSVASVTDLADELQSMVEVTTVATHYDWLKMESDRFLPVPALLLFLEGLFIGIALTLMLSRHQQKRFQLILSPLMGIAAGIIMQYMGDESTYFMRQFIAFSLFGLVIMQKNTNANKIATATVSGSDGFDF